MASGKTKKRDVKSSKNGSETSALPKGAIAIAFVSLLCGSLYYMKSSDGGGGRQLEQEPQAPASLLQESEPAAELPGSVLVRFRNAGATKKTVQFDVATNFSRADFEAFSEQSSFYAGDTGQRLRSWEGVVKFVNDARDPEGEDVPVLLQGPPQDLPSTRHFVWPGEVGQRITVADVPNHDKTKPIELESLSVNPRVFYVHNFMSSEEANALVEKATSPSNPYSIRPSTVGHQAWGQGEGIKNTDSTRTSENGFDINSPTASRLKRRAWSLLRLSGGYDEAMVDGFQVLRYELKQAYISHMDSFPLHTSTDHNWDPANGGTNRFATLLVYLSDVDEGGQTVFPKAASENSQEVPAVAAKLFERSSWEAKLVKDCYSKLSIQPKKGNAILFYSQGTGGKINQKALHGGCPVLNGTKWAANLWFWNQCRFSQCTERHIREAGVKMTKEQLKQR